MVYLKRVILLVFIVVFFIKLVNADSYINLIPKSASINLNSLITIDVNTSIIQNDLYAYEFEINYDSSKLSLSGLSNVTEGTFLSQSGTFKTHFKVKSAGGGLIFVYASRNGSVQGAKGSGTLARIQFLGVATGNALVKITKVKFVNSTINNQSVREIITILTDNSTITINTGSLPCTITSAIWNQTLVNENNYVEARVTGTNCDGKQINMTIWEDDSIIDELLGNGDDKIRVNPGILTFSSGVAKYIWKAEWQSDVSGDPEYYFRGYEISNPVNTYKSSNQVSVPKDSLAPVISNIQSTTTTTSATITWSTNELSNSSVDSSGPDKGDTTYLTLHSIILTGLNPGTTYSYTVTSCDQSLISNCATSFVQQFSTQNTGGVAPWWNTNYNFRKRVIVTNNMLTTLSLGNQVNFEFDQASLVNSGKSLSNGEDVRIIYYNGVSNIELDRFNDNGFNIAKSSLWFKLQNSIGAGGFDDNYWLYYGYSGATSAPRNGNNIFSFFDDFNSLDTNKWVSSGVTINSGVANIVGYLTSLQTFNTNQILSSRILLTDNTTANSPSWWFGFQCQGTDCLTIPWILWIKRIGVGLIRPEHEGTSSFSGPDVGYDANRYYLFTVKWRPSTQVIWQRDKSTINTYSSNVNNAPISVRYKAFSYPGTIKVDWMFMANYNYPEPTLSLSSEEARITDTIPPTITNIAANPSTTSSLITWNTDELSNSTVYFGTSPNTNLKIGNSNNILNHNINLSSLLPNTLYYYNVSSCDPSNNCAVSLQQTFTTLQQVNITPAQYLLTVTKSGLGSGVVTSNPVGINCGLDCVEIYLDGTSIILTASAFNGSTFIGWSGVCTGTGTCNLIMNSNKTVNANFDILGGGEIDTIPPIVSIKEPLNNSILPNKGSVKIRTSAIDNKGVKEIRIYIDNGLVKSCLNVNTCDYTWSVNRVSEGNHSITANAYDLSNNLGTSSIIVSKAPTGKLTGNIILKIFTGFFGFK